MQHVLNFLYLNVNWQPAGKCGSRSFAADVVRNPGGIVITETIAPTEKETMSIGELARRMGITTRTVRYYEEMGLLVGATRGTNGRRIYTEDHLYQLRLIRRGKLLGMSLAEIKELAEVFRQNGTERSVIQRSIEILTFHLDEVEDKLKKLENYRELLAGEIKRVKGLL